MINHKSINQFNQFRTLIKKIMKERKITFLTLAELTNMSRQKLYRLLSSTQSFNERDINIICKVLNIKIAFTNDISVCNKCK